MCGVSLKFVFECGMWFGGLEGRGGGWGDVCGWDLAGREGEGRWEGGMWDAVLSCRLYEEGIGEKTSWTCLGGGAWVDGTRSRLQ